MRTWREWVSGMKAVFQKANMPKIASIFVKYNKIVLFNTNAFTTFECEMALELIDLCAGIR